MESSCYDNKEFSLTSVVNYVVLTCLVQTTVLQVFGVCRCQGPQYFCISQNSCWYLFCVVMWFVGPLLVLFHTNALVYILPCTLVLSIQFDLLKSTIRLLKNHCEYSFTRVVRLFEDSSPVQGIGKQSMSLWSWLLEVSWGICFKSQLLHLFFGTARRSQFFVFNHTQSS